MKIKDILLDYKLSLSSTPRLDLDLLIGAAIGKPREFVYVSPGYQLNETELANFKEMYTKRNLGQPISYILKKKEFWSMEFTVNDQVLVPRPETELLVEIALEKINLEEATVADLGTGCGAIALALAASRPEWKVIATDISNSALKLASDNALAFGISNVNFYHGDWYQALPEVTLSAIISNPPYLSDQDGNLTSGDGIRFEPRSALIAKDNGLDDLSKIIQQAKFWLSQDGWLILEHGASQRLQVIKMLVANGYRVIETYQDLAGLDRAVLAKID